MNIIKYYLVDSENVNDNWLMLLDLAGEEDELIIFYTKNSPHMSYMSVVKLLGNTSRKITFEECYEGNNALDFQLISYMGYLMSEASLHDGTEYIVMSNDTGFDAAVKFWKKKGFLVRRVNVNFCKIALHKQKTAEAETPSESLALTETVPDKLTPAETVPAEPIPTQTAPTEPTPTQTVPAKVLPTRVVPAEATPAKPETTEILALETDVTRLPEFVGTEEQLSLNLEETKETEAASSLAEPAEDEAASSLVELAEDEAAGSLMELAEDETASALVELAEDEAPIPPAETEEFKGVTYLPEFAESVEDPQEDSEGITHLPEFAEEEEEASPYDFNKKEVDEIINCITKDCLESLHETLVHIYGRDQGQKIYKTIKANAYPYKQTFYSRKEKVTHITDIIFLHSELKNPGDFVDFLEKNKNKTKNLNGIRSAINKTYGSANGIKYYSLFKPYFKIISAMK